MKANLFCFIIFLLRRKKLKEMALSKKQIDVINRAQLKKMLIYFCKNEHNFYTAYCDACLHDDFEYCVKIMDQVAEEYGIEEVLADAEVSGQISYLAKKLKSKIPA